MIWLKSFGVVVVAMFAASCMAVPNDEGPTFGETGGMCGGFAGTACQADDDYCRFQAGTCHQIADVAGKCTNKPQICTMEYRPVCGCDGNTYPSACSAASKGVSVASEGVCKE
ncbi:Kazal-type serine protease inhibitor family protein [Hyphococcus lacteus]|uniref:Kazal-type serine protease inhibitor family protein n=1 Tax=Hyphococcus lacteus TaxID=3143536 RepID=A0ABV3Z4T4_9PROT